MNSNRSLKQHWGHVSIHFAIDAAIFIAAFLVGTRLRFWLDPERATDSLVLFYPGVLDGAAGLRFMGVLDPEHNYRPKIF